MRSNDMRKSKRKPILYVWAWIFAAIFGVFSVVYTPLLVLRNVRLEGAKPENREYLSAAIKTQDGVQLRRVNPTSIESMALAVSAIQGADFTMNWLGQGKLAVSYRKPVAQFSHDSRLYLDASGAVFRDFGKHDGLSKVQVSADLLRASGSLAALWPKKAASSLIQEMEMRKLGPGTLQIDAAGEVSYRGSSGAQIRFGSSQDLSAKLDVLDELMTTNPELLAQNEQVILVSPKNPALRPKTK